MYLHPLNHRTSLSLSRNQIIDEVSMLSAEFFQQIDAKLKEIRGNGKPVGGLQLVMCGDFFQ